MKYDKQNVSVEYMGVSEDILKWIEKAGKLSHKAESNVTDTSYMPFINMLKNVHHDSVLEHGVIGVIVKTDRGVTHEIVRHRIGSYTQESTRYCNYTKDKFGNQITLIPSKRLENDADFIHCMETMEECYFKLLEKGFSLDEARDVLPTCLKTEIAITYNIRQWRWFFHERLPRYAHPKIREVAKMLLKLFQQRIPVVFDDITEEGEFLSFRNI